MKFIENIFSVKNENNHKILTICWIKFKFYSPRKELHNLRNEIGNQSIKVNNQVISEFIDLAREEGYFLSANRGFNLNPEKKVLKEQIKNKTNNHEYKMTHRSCLCGANNDKLLAIRDRYGIEINTVICKNCGLIRSNPYYDEKTLNDFYNIEYRELYTFVNNDKEKFFNNQVNIGNKIIENIINNFSFTFENKIVYEIGTGMGGILKAFKDRGATIKGVDLGKEYIEIGKSKGLDIEVGSTETLGKYGQADLIILNHVIEHIVNPVDFLMGIKSLLKEDGLLYIAVPTIETIQTNYRNNIFHYLQNAHVYNFSQETLTYVIECAGYNPNAHIYSDGAIICKKANKNRAVDDINIEHYNYAMALLKKCDMTFYSEYKNI